MPRVWQDYANEAIRELYPTSRRDVDYAWARLDPATEESMLYDAIGMDISAIQALANRKMGQDPYNDYDPARPAPSDLPVITSLSQNTAVVGAAAFTLSVYGSGFSASAVIVWNNGDEATTVVDDTELTTGVDPTTASGAVTIPVQVRDGAYVTNALPFTFTEA